MLNGLDLFTGIGGITVALKEWVIPIAYCESEEYAIGVLPYFPMKIDPIIKGIEKLRRDREILLTAMFYIKDELNNSIGNVVDVNAIREIATKAILEVERRP